MNPFKFFATQKESFEYALSEKHEFFFAVDKANDGRKKYGSYKNANDFLSIYKALPEDKKHFYEILTENAPRFEYYDIDEKETMVEPEKILAKFFSIRLKFLKYQFGLFPPEDEWRIMDSSKRNENGSWKISFHLINRSVVWKNQKETEFWYKLFHDYNQTHCGVANLFDTAVDTKNRCMRIIGSSKFAQIRPLMPLDSCTKYDMIEFFITNTNGKQSEINLSGEIEKFQENELQYKAENKKIIDYANSFKETILLNEDYDEVEKLVDLIRVSILASKHSLCDEGKPQLTYANFRNLCFAYVNASQDKIEAKMNFLETEVYPLYRHSKDYECNVILSSILKSERDGKCYTKASLHFWAKENENYKELFQVKKYVGIKQFDSYDTYDWADFKDEMETQIFESFEDVRKCFLRNFNRVCVPICLGEDNFYIKQADQMNDFEFVLTKQVKFEVRYLGISKKGDKEELTINFKKLYRECLDNLMRFKNFGFCPYSPKNPAGASLKEGIFNQFSGFKAKYLGNDDNKSKIQFILDFLKLVWCNNDEAMFQYLLTWFAHIVQKPHKKTRVLILLYSKEHQIGKGLFLEWFIKSVIGLRHGVKTNSISHAVGRFNKAIENKIVFGIDEVVGDEQVGIKEMQKLKSLITDEIQQIERKGIDPHTSLDCINYITCTNNENALSIEDKDSRICVYECNPHYQGKTKELDKIRTKMSQEGMNDEFFTYLMNYNIVIDLRNVPSSKMKEEMISNTAEQPVKFFKEIENGLFSLEINRNKIIRKVKEEKESIYITAKDLFDIFEFWTMERREKQGIYSVNKFGRFAKKYLPSKVIFVDKSYNVYDITKYSDKIILVDKPEREAIYN